MDLNHKPFEQLYLASFGQILMIKTNLSKFSIPSQHYLKLVMTRYHHYKKSWFFLLGKLIEKVTFCTFDDLTKELFWASPFEQSIHPIVNLTNNKIIVNMYGFYSPHVIIS
jgi:hypothetical protein